MKPKTKPKLPTKRKTKKTKRVIHATGHTDVRRRVPSDLAEVINWLPDSEIRVIAKESGVPVKKLKHETAEAIAKVWWTARARVSVTFVVTTAKPL